MKRLWIVESAFGFLDVITDVWFIVNLAKSQPSGDLWKWSLAILVLSSVYGIAFLQYWLWTWRDRRTGPTALLVVLAVLAGVTHFNFSLILTSELCGVRHFKHKLDKHHLELVERGSIGLHLEALAQIIIQSIAFHNFLVQGYTDIITAVSLATASATLLVSLLVWVQNRRFSNGQSAESVESEDEIL